MQPSTTLAFGPPQTTPTGPACTVTFNGNPVATLYRTDTPENDLWEPGMPGPVRVPGFTVYTLRSINSGAVLSSTDRDALLQELMQRLST